MFKKIKNFIFIMLFLALIIGPIFSWGLLQKMNESNPKIMETLDFSLNEKRKKATLSEPIDLSKITYELDAYFNDRLPFRSIMIYAKRVLDGKLDEIYKNKFEKSLLKLFAKKKDYVVVEQADEVDGKVVKYMDEAVDIYFNHGLAKDEIDPYDSSIEYPIKYLTNNKVIVGQSDWLYLNDLNITYYKGENKFKDEEEIKKYVEKYIMLKKQCDKVGKKLVILICPEKEEIYPEYMPTMEITNEVERIIDIREYLKNNTDITYIYPKEELLKAKKNYLLYKKYDSHWNRVGAYIAINEVKKALGLDVIPLRDLKLSKVETMDADLVYYGNATMDTLPKTFVYNFDDYKTDHEVEVVFDNNPVTHDFYTTHCKQGFDMKLFLIGDSFRESMDNFMQKDFSEYFCNTFLDAAKGGFLDEEIKRADVIMISLVERNEGIVLPALCDIITNALVRYEYELNQFIAENSK